MGSRTAAAGRPSGASQELRFSRESRVGLQVIVGCLLAVAVIVYAVAADSSSEAGQGRRRMGGLESKLYAWTNGNDKSRYHRTSVISGMDADDPAFAPERDRVPPVDRTIAQLKGRHNPEFYDAEQHGPNAQFVHGGGFPFAKDSPDGVVLNERGDAVGATDSGTAYIVDPAATDDAQFNINLLLRKSGRMVRDASELAGLQQEDELITGQYQNAKKRAASLLTLEGDMKHELQELSAQQMSIINQIQNITANETAASEADEAEASTTEVGGGEEEGNNSEDPDVPSASDDPGAAEKGRGKTPMLAWKHKPAGHLPSLVRWNEEVRRQVVRRRAANDVGKHKGSMLKIPVSQNKEKRALLLKIPAVQSTGVHGEATEGGRGGSIAARVARAGVRAAKSAAKVGSLLDEAKHDVERQAAVQAVQARRHAQLQHALTQQAHLKEKEEMIRREEHEALLRREGHARDRVRKEEHARTQHEEARKPATHSRVRHTGAP